jgi:antitoxin VapB
MTRKRVRMALNIKNGEVERLAAESGRLAGETKTETIRRALEERLARLRLRVARRGREADILAYLEREVWPAVPKRLLGRRLSRREEDRVLGYGPEGV